jgi:putative oxidoreductase
LLVHAWGKIQLGPTKMAPAFANMGFEPGVFYWMTFLVEGLGGLGILLGLFTRFFAAMVAIEMFVIFCVYWHTGFSWLSRGYEYALLWGLVSFAIALRGGGPFSLDRRIGVQL